MRRGTGKINKSLSMLCREEEGQMGLIGPVLTMGVGIITVMITLLLVSQMNAAIPLTDSSNVVNESWVPDEGNWTDLNHENLVSSSVVVYNDSGTLMGESNYTIGATGGRLKALDPDNNDTTGLQSGASATASYTYEHRTSEETQIIGYFYTGILILGIGFIVIGGVFTLRALTDGLGGVRGRRGGRR